MLFTQMRYFQTVCRFGSFTKAAEALAVSQPAISMSVKNLEEELGFKLFIRDGRVVRLTEEGQRFLRAVDGLLTHADEVMRNAKDSAAGCRQIRLGLTPMLAIAILPVLYKEFLNRHPEIRFNVVEAPRRELEQMLKRDQVDAILVNMTPKLGRESAFRRTKIMDMQYCLCVSEEHPLAQCRTVTIPEIGSAPLICFGIEYEQPQFLRDLFAPFGLEPNLLYHANSVSTIVEMIQHNGFGGFMYQSLAKKWPELRFIPIEPAVGAQPHLFWKKDAYSMENIRKLISGMHYAVGNAGNTDITQTI